MPEQDEIGNKADKHKHSYINASDVAERFSLPLRAVHHSLFWAKFCFYAGRPFHSSKRFDDSLIQVYFREKRGRGKVYTLTTWK